jgi:surface polysaccharide O-acyltransferase-like enzyme
MVSVNFIIKNQPILEKDNGLIAGLLTGTSCHLWYMPFIFAAAIVCSLLQRNFNEKVLALMCTSLVVLLFLTTGSWRYWALSLGYPWAQYAHAINGVLIGVFLANGRALPNSLFVSCIFIILVIIYSSVLSYSGVGVPYLIGTIATASVLLPQWNWHFDLNINELSECTLGIYLSHVFWVMVVKKFCFSIDQSLPFLLFLQ